MSLAGHVPSITKLLVGRYEPRVWWWAVVEPDGYVLTDGLGESWGDALRTGLDAVQQMSDELDRNLR